MKFPPTPEPIKVKRTIRTKAQTKALLTLSHNHPEEYRELYEAEKARLVAEYEEVYGPVPDLRTSPYRAKWTKK